MKKTLLFTLGLSFLFFFFSCKNADKNETKKNENTKTEIIDQKEDFTSFYKKFVTDYNFQLERIKFPIKGTNILDYDQEEQWTKENWKKLTNIDEVDNKEFKVEKNETETKVEHKIYLPNSGFSVSYTFELINNQWFLTERTDSDL